MMILKIILFLSLYIDNSLSSEWNCTLYNNLLSNNQRLHFSNLETYEQCTVTVEYINLEYEKQVCIAHTLAITSLPSPSMTPNHTMQTFKINSCQLSTLAQLPFSLPSTVEILDLSNNLLSTFTLSFPLPSNLKYLYLDNNPNLIDINFGNKRVQQRLVGLSLRHNKNMKLSSLPTHLTQLDLTNCNVLQSAVLPLLISLKKLTHLSLANNQLEKLPSIDESIQLEYLNISNNHLTFIEDGWLHRQLHTLDLQFNRIESLEFLKNRLQFMSTQNQTSISDYEERRTIHQTLQLFLYGNPLTCDCWLGALADSSLSSIIISDLHLLQCQSRSLMDIPRSDLLCSYSRHCTSDCSCCDFEACDCHSVCPSECSCLHDIHWSNHLVKCSKSNLSNIHMFLPQTITELDYENNNIEEIKTFVFVGKTSLIKLNLSKNNIKYITNETFCPAINLRELDLSENLNLMPILAKIDDLFGCLKHLQTITLSKKQIQEQNMINSQWFITSNRDHSNELVQIKRLTQKNSALPSSSTLMNVLTSATNRPARNSPIQSIISSSIHQREYTTVIPTSALTDIRHVSFMQHNQTLIIVVFFLLLFVLLFLILLITLAVCRRKLRRHLTVELQRQRSHHCYYHTRLHQPSIQPTDVQCTVGTNDSLYEQLPSLSSDSEQPFLYNEKKSNNTVIPKGPQHPPVFRYHCCCHPSARLIPISPTNQHEYQYATAGYSTPTSQQQQCTAILVWANRLLYPTSNAYDHNDCSSHSCSSELQHLQQCLLSNQQDRTSITTENNIQRFTSNTNCRCNNGHVHNTETYIYPHVYR